MATLSIHRAVKVTVENRYHKDIVNVDFHTLTLEVTDDNGNITTVYLFSAEPLNIEKS